MKEYKISILNIRKYNLRKHFLQIKNPTLGILEVSDALIGLHSARLPTPYVSLHSRIDGIKTTDLYQELFVKKKLIKLRCMRKTLHSVSFELAPIVHKATLSLRLREIQLFYEKNGISQNDLGELKSLIIKEVKKCPRSRDYLVQNLQNLVQSTGLGSVQSLPKMVIKELWESGQLCYINGSKHWGRETRFYGHTRTEYPGLDLESYNEDSAQTELVLRHIKQFGPVSLKDISWWSGLKVSKIRSIISSHSHLLALVQLNGIKCYFFEEEILNLLNGEYEKGNSLYLLAYEDSSLKGYYETRFRYVDSKNYEKLFNSIGEARASIVLDGQVIGIWNWNRKQEVIEYEIFDKKNAIDQKLLIEKRIEEMECYLKYQQNMTIQFNLFK